MRWIDRLSTAQRVVVIIALGLALAIVGQLRQLSASAGAPIRSGIEKRQGVAGPSLSAEGRA
jgi:hypothetical protein